MVPDFGEYASFIWGAYAVSGVLMLWLAAHSLTQWRQSVKALEKAQQLAQEQSHTQ